MDTRYHSGRTMSANWSKKTISVWEYIERYQNDDDVRVIKGSERNRLVDVLVKDGKRVGGGSISLRSLF